MSDTATEAPVEAEAKTTGPKADYPKVLSDAFLAAADDILANEGALSEDGKNALQEAFRSVPSASRGKAQGEALMAVISAGKDAALEAILDACNNLPAAKSASRTSTPSLDPVTALAVQIAGTLVAYSDLGSTPDIGADAVALANEWYQAEGGYEGEHKDRILKTAANIVSASAKRRGGSGTRSQFSQTVADLIEAGAIEVGTTLYGPKDVKAKVQKDGKIKVGNSAASDSPTAAARLAKGEPKASVNGWDFWEVEVEDAEAEDGIKRVSLGSLRTS